MTLMKKQPQWLETVLSLLLITLVTIVTYGYMIPKLGFYRDDWYMIWSAQAQGIQGVMDLFKIDRPLLGILYAFDYSLLGKAVINWQIYALLIKLAGGFALFWMLRMLWPERKLATTFSVLLFMVYPGFYQQPNAALFKNLLLCYTSAVLSLALTVYSLKSQNTLARIGAIILAIGLAIFYLVIYEAMIGMEAARVLVIAYVVFQRESEWKWKSIFVKTLKNSIPYLIVAIGFVYWRLFIFQSTRRATNVDVLLGEYTASPVHGVLRLFIETAKDLFDTSIFAWVVPLYQNVTYSEYRDLIEALILAAIAIGLVILYYVWLRRKNLLEDGDLGSSNQSFHMIVLGALVVLVTTLPIIAAGRDVTFSFQWDRYTVQSIFGVALLMVGLAFAYVRPPARWIFLLALIGSGVITQVQSAVFYRDFWTQERDFWWQLSWRAPGLQPGTTVVASLPAGFRFLEEYEVWGPLNIIYNPGGPLVVSGQVPFDGIEAAVADGGKENRLMRSINVERDYSKTLVVSKPTPNSCVHVINGQRLELPFEEDSRIRSIAPYSRLDLVLTDATPKVPPTDVFGREPQHDWCYYYQKIDLARQTENWNLALDFVEEAMDLGVEPADRSEWLPVVETYVNAGELEKATQTARKIRTDKNLRETICSELRSTTQWHASTDGGMLIQTVCEN